MEFPAESTNEKIRAEKVSQGVSFQHFSHSFEGRKLHDELEHFVKYEGNETATSGIICKV